MICPKCGVAAQIARAKIVVEGDDSPERETKVYTVQEFVCRNPACECCGQTVGEARHRIY